MTKIEEHLGVKFGEAFRITTIPYIRYYITSNLDLYRVSDNELSKDYTALDLLRDPKLIKRITIDKYDMMGLKFYQAKGYKYITRDINGEVWIWKQEPRYCGSIGSWIGEGLEEISPYHRIQEFEHIDEIVHRKEKPYTIEEIIKKGEEQ